MKRIMKIASVLAVVAELASCAEKENPVSGNKEVPGGNSDALANTEIVALFESTKVSYAEESTDLRPSWEAGDVVIAIADGVYAGETSRFTVKSVNEDGSANLQGLAHTDCTLHLVYCPGVKEGTEIPVDYTAQTGTQKTMPAVMFSDGEVKGGKGEFKFRNAGGMIGISAVNGVPQGAKVTKITVSGENLSAATIALSGSALALTAATKANDAISVEGIDLTVTDAKGALSVPVFIAVPAEAKIAKVSAFVAAREPETMKIPSTAADKKNIDYVTIGVKKWAKWNVGANSETDYGWYFHWGGTEGYVYKNSHWVPASGREEYSYSPSSAYKVIASDYVYVKIQSFKIPGPIFTWEYTPFNNGEDFFDEQYFRSVVDMECPKRTLAFKNDAARANWGGTWRMPTSDEFKALRDATYWAWDATDKGYYVFSPDASHSAGTRVFSIPEGLSKSAALLFFPAAGSGRNDNFTNSPGLSGDYWSSELYTLNNYISAHYLSFSKSSADPRGTCARCDGMTVRPISD